MPPKPQRARKKRRTSITRQIERWPRIKVVENKWIRRGVGGKLVDITIERADGMVFSVGPSKLPPYKFAIHTHTKAEERHGALPSCLDLVNHVLQFKKHDFQNSTVIASVNTRGKVTGYAFVKTRKLAPDVKIDNSALSDLYHRMKDLGAANKEAGAEDVLAAYRKAFSEFGLELKIRFFPLPVYGYDKEGGRFVPKRK